jgi:hypothetical protein
VLNVSTGHTHTGASENGKKVHGTALDTTGATNGQVLTANGSGGASFAAVASSGAFSVTYATATFSTAVATTTPYLTAASTGACSLGVGASGSVIMTITNNNNYSASARTIRVFTLGNGTHTATTSLSPVVAGTTITDQIGCAGFRAGSTFTVKENRGSGGTWTTYLRKFTTGLTNSWNTTLATFSLTGNYSESKGPFGGGGNEYNIKWAQELGAWYGGDYRDTSMATATTGGAGTVSVWVVNDASGSAYSAPFGTASATRNAYTQATVFVPDNVGTPTAGTIHAWGVIDTAGVNQMRYCVYTVGSASITAVSTAVPDIFNMYAESTNTGPAQAMWDSDRQQILIFVSGGGVIALDRTGSFLWRTAVGANLRLDRLANASPTRRVYANAEGDIANQYDINSGNFITTTSGRPVMWKMGAVGPSMIPFSPVQYNVDTTNYGPAYIAGVGSATDYVYCLGGAGTVYSQKIAGVASVTIAGTASNSFRQISAELYQPLGDWEILSFDAQAGYEVGFAGTAIENLGFLASSGYHIVPGTVSYRMNVAINANSTAASAQRSNFDPSGSGPKYVTLGGTAKVVAYTTTMA